MIKRLKLGMDFNHDRPLTSFQESLNIIRSAGFKPIAVTQMMFEDTFVFETSEESDRAYEQLEKAFYGQEESNKSVVGWWYGKEEFLETVKQYEEDGGYEYKVLIYWL